MKPEIKLGQVVKCKITGFTGTATSVTQYLNGTIEYGVRPRVDKDGVMQDTVFIDHKSLYVIEPKSPIGFTITPKNLNK